MWEPDDLQDSLGLTIDELVLLLGVSKATPHRRRLTGRLTLTESERAVLLARLVGKAIEVLESESGARQRLRSPQVGFSGEGASRNDGRWNLRGVRVVYSSSTKVLADLETWYT